MDIQECTEKAIRASLANLLAHVESKNLAENLAAAAELELSKKKTLLSSSDVARLYSIPTAAIATWRYRAISPNQTKTEGSIFYTHQQIEHWITQKEVNIIP